MSAERIHTVCTEKELAERFGMDQRTVAKWRKSRVIPEGCYKIVTPKVIFYLPDKINEWLEGNGDLKSRASRRQNGT